MGVVCLVFVLSLVAAALPQPAAAAGGAAVPKDKYQWKDKNFFSTCLYVTRVRANESLLDVARRVYIGWRVLARVNGLSSPYEVDYGDRLCVPSRNVSMKMLKELGY